MPAQHTYTVAMSALYPSDIGAIIRDDGFSVLWSDADFQLWNASQQTPHVLSPVLLAIAQAKQSTFAQFQAWVATQYGVNPAPPTAIQRLWYELIQRGLRGEIV